MELAWHGMVWFHLLVCVMLCSPGYTSRFSCSWSVGGSKLELYVSGRGRMERGEN